MSTVTSNGKRKGAVTRADIEAKLDQIRGVTDEQVEKAEEATKAALIAGGILLIIVAFLLGKRRGSKKSTIVEIRRI
jgi:hypothetical protein